MARPAAAPLERPVCLTIVGLVPVAELEAGEADVDIERVGDAGADAGFPVLLAAPDEEATTLVDETGKKRNCPGATYPIEYPLSTNGVAFGGPISGRMIDVALIKTDGRAELRGTMT